MADFTEEILKRKIDTDAQMVSELAIYQAHANSLDFWDDNLTDYMIMPK